MFMNLFADWAANVQYPVVPPDNLCLSHFIDSRGLEGHFEEFAVETQLILISPLILKGII